MAKKKDLTHQVESLHLGDTEINLDHREVDIVRGLLTGEERRNVVVFGEGNFTFSMALASCRQSWDGIMSTRYELPSDQHPKPQFCDVQVETSQYCIQNGKMFGDESDQILSNAKLILHMPSPSRLDDTWKFGVDATKLPGNVDVREKVAWFQCPWITREDKESGKTTDGLVASFLKHMVDKQCHADYALVGIVNKSPCVEDYKLQELLGEELANDDAHGYQFLGADKKFVRELLQYGYWYTGCVGKHIELLDDHITLVFRKPEKIKISYADNKSAYVNQSDILRGLLAGEEKRDIVVFGEGNFTFSVALASLRGSWDGILSTCYGPPSDKPEFFDVQVETIQYCIRNGTRFGDASDAVLSKAKVVLRLPSPPKLDDTWKFGVDATNLPDDIKVKRKVVWFQCPWISMMVRGKTTSGLVAGFLKHMEGKQRRGDYALVGIANLFPYVKNYQLQELLGEDLANDHAHGYQFLGADNKFIWELLQYGYHHQGRKDIHNDILTSHITLLFCRK